MKYVLPILLMALGAAAYCLCVRICRRSLIAFRKVLNNRKERIPTEWCETYYATLSEKEKRFIVELLSWFQRELKVPIWRAMPPDRLDELTGLPFTDRIFGDTLFDALEEMIPDFHVEIDVKWRTLNDLIVSCVSQYSGLRKLDHGGRF